MPGTPQTVICVPGRWPTRREFVTAVASESGGYLFAGVVLMKVGASEPFDLELCDHDPELRNAFSIAGRGRLKDADLQAIGSHTLTAYVIAQGGSVETATRLLHAANGLLKAGGMAVKVESAGTAHRSDQWAEFSADNRLGSLLRAYVTYIGSRGTYYSCGMHNLGLPDAIVEAAIPPNDAANLLHTFLGYILVEQPTLKDRETFSVDADAPRYRLFRERCTLYDVDDLFHNPFGMWKLVPE